MTTSTFRPQNWRVSPVWIVLAAALLLFIAFLPAQGWASLTFTLVSFGSITPFLLLSVVLAGWVKASSLDKQLGRVFAGRTALVIVSAAAFGALSPFCSCGVIPIIAALLAAGVPLAGIMAFWLASPLMSPEIFLLTAAELGMGFAVARVATALGIGLLSGAVVAWLQASGHLLNPQKHETKPSCGCSNPLKNAAVTWWFWGDPERRRVFWANVRDTGVLLSKWLLVAFFLESLLLRFVPAELVVSWLGDGIWALPLATLVGVPAYLNGYAAIPLMAGLVDLGMAPAAGLAFLTAGAATSIPAAMAVYPLVKRNVFLCYVGLALVGSWLAGVIYGVFV
jgi:uncharacterized membrane protein YraQ (UPF0718 family)